jgi:carbamoyltransferase
VITSEVAALAVPDESQWTVLRKFAERLHELGYTEEAVTRAMGVSDHSVRHMAAWPAHVRNCRRQKTGNPCALLAAFFLAEESVERQELEAVLGVDVVKVLEQLDFIGQLDGKHYFRYFLYPLLGTVLLTDGCVSNPNHLDQVYPLGGDSHALARYAPRPRVGLALDHCTGSGVHAVLAGGHCERAFGVDINPRALAFSRFNARLNGRDNVSFVESDCYQNVDGQNMALDGPLQFDLITANPPFVPTPETLSLCRGGGLSGEEVTAKIIAGLPPRLKADGTFSMITQIPNLKRETFFSRCQRWLGGGETWAMAVLTNHAWAPEVYVLGHQTPVAFEDYGANFQRWLDAYEEMQLESITASQVYLFRSWHPFRIERRCAYPHDAKSGFVEGWLASMRAYSPQSSAGYRLHPGLDRVWWREDRAAVYLDWKPELQWWSGQGLWLEGPAAQAVARLQSRPQGCAASELEGEGMVRLLEESLATLA